MTGKRKQAPAYKEPWYESPWAKITGVLLTVFALFSAGFTTATYLKGLEHKMEINNLTQKHNEQIQAEIRACKEARDNETRTMVVDLRRVVDEIQKGK